MMSKSFEVIIRLFNNLSPLEKSAIVKMLCKGWIQSELERLQKEVGTKW